MLDQPNTQLEFLLKETPLLDFRAPNIRQLVEQRKWMDLPLFDRAGAVYDFVRNEIKFGYNKADNIPASQVVTDGIGQCNTKGTLLMALMRAVGIPCRLHGFTIHKQLQRGVVPELIYRIAPENILHSWVEIYLEDRWINLEGFILDELPLSVAKGICLKPPIPMWLWRWYHLPERPSGQLERAGYLHPENRYQQRFRNLQQP